MTGVQTLHVLILHIDKHTCSVIDGLSACHAVAHTPRAPPVSCSCRLHVMASCLLMTLRRAQPQSPPSANVYPTLSNMHGLGQMMGHGHAPTQHALVLCMSSSEDDRQTSAGDYEPSPARPTPKHDNGHLTSTDSASKPASIGNTADTPFCRRGLATAPSHTALRPRPVGRARNGGTWGWDGSHGRHGELSLPSPRTAPHRLTRAYAQSTAYSAYRVCRVYRVLVRTVIWPRPAVRRAS